jgi:hypothetical protein
MRSDRATRSKVDSLDVAAIWPCCAQVAGLSLPPIEAARAPEPARPAEADSHGIW